MVAANPELRARVRPYRAGKSLEYRAGNSYYRAISSEGATKHGYNAHGIVVDELHVQPDGDLVDALETSVGARRQPMTVYVSTSDYERQSICNEKYDYAAKVRDGTFRDPRWLPCIWEATRSDDWRDPKTWAKANPNLGRSVSLEYVQDECRQAQRVPRKLNVFLRLQLNLRTQAESAWLPKEEWAACAGSRSYAELVEHLKGKRAIGGLDCSAVKDLTAFVLYFPEERACLTWAWVPQGTLELRGAREGDPYAAWASEGYLEVLPGKAMDLEKVRRRIGEICEPYRVQEINFDRWGAVQIATQLRDDGFDVVKFGQGFASMSEPSKHLERLVLDRALVHGGHPVLTYCALNAMVVTDPADNIKPVKNPSQAGEHGRIDALVALVMGIGGAIVKSESDDGRSVYDSRGIERL
jgi:phage terminase large subunit-like protein